MAPRIMARVMTIWLMPLSPSGADSSCRCASIAHCSPVAARIGPALQQTLLAIDTDGVGVPHVVVPIGHHLHGLTAALQLAHDLVRDASFERQLARARAPGAAHQPTRRFDRLLHVVAEIDKTGCQRR